MTTVPARFLTIALAAAALVSLLGAAALAAPDHAPGPDCQALVTYSTQGVQGDDLTVAITSQSLQADVPGWGHISWQAAPTTSVTAVVVTGPDGTTTLTGGGLASGTITDVLAVTFCGTVATAAVASGMDSVMHWAAIIRSNGSRCCHSIDPASRLCSSLIGMLCTARRARCCR
jgi:hypothetical protein